MEYKYLTKDMQIILINKINEIGNDKLYNIIEMNNNIIEVISLMNNKNGFDFCYKNNCKYNWEFNFKYKPVIVDNNNFTLAQEIFYFIEHN